jgi:hypothetical protein
MQISRTRIFTGDPAPAFDLAVNVLVANGFRLERRDAQTIVAIGRGMASTRQNPLTGAGRVVLSRSGRDLRLEADLGGVRTLARLMIALPLGLCVAFGVSWFLSGASRSPLPTEAALVVAPWLVISPLMIVMARRRTVRALDDLLASLAAPAGARSGAAGV